MITQETQKITEKNEQQKKKDYWRFFYYCLRSLRLVGIGMSITNQRRFCRTIFQKSNMRKK